MFFCGVEVYYCFAAKPVLKTWVLVLCQTSDCVDVVQLSQVRVNVCFSLVSSLVCDVISDLLSDFRENLPSGHSIDLAELKIWYDVGFGAVENQIFEPRIFLEEPNHCFEFLFVHGFCVDSFDCRFIVVHDWWHVVVILNLVRVDVTEVRVVHHFEVFLHGVSHEVLVESEWS